MWPYILTSKLDFRARIISRFILTYREDMAVWEWVSNTQHLWHYFNFYFVKFICTKLTLTMSQLRVLYGSVTHTIRSSYERNLLAVIVQINLNKDSDPPTETTNNQCRQTDWHRKLLVAANQCDRLSAIGHDHTHSANTIVTSHIPVVTIYPTPIQHTKPNPPFRLQSTRPRLKESTYLRDA